MKYARLIPSLIAAIFAAMLLIGPAVAADAARDATAVVAAFNSAVSDRNLDETLSHLVNGGVQFNLRPAHTGLGNQQGITTDLRAHWSTIGSVLFAATKAYSRRIEVIGSQAEGDIATVWTKTRTETVRADKPETARDNFIEVYLLVRKDNEWKIGAIADNRRPNDVGFGGAKP